MNLQILPVLACSLNDAVQAEALCDYMALLKNKQPSGYLLLAFAPDVHAEMQTRIRIAAEIGFETVEVFVCPKYEGHKGKAEAVNWLFQKTAGHLARTYKLPFLLFEPDCVPLTPDWLQNISDAYCEQPKLYMSNILSDAEKRKCIGRVGVYPRGAAQDLNPSLESKQPFEIVAGEALVAKTAKTRLIQMLPILDPMDREKIRPDAVLLHGDKSGILLSALMDGMSKRTVVADFQMQEMNIGPDRSLPISLTSETKNAALRIEVQPPESGAAISLPVPVTPKLDGRSRAARAARAQQHA